MMNDRTDFDYDKYPLLLSGYINKYLTSTNEREQTNRIRNVISITSKVAPFSRSTLSLPFIDMLRTTNVEIIEKENREKDITDELERIKKLKTKKKQEQHEEKPGNKAALAGCYILTAMFLIGFAMCAEIYSNWYKLTGFNGSLHDFKVTQLSTNALWLLVATNLAFSAHMSISGNIKRLYAKWKEDDKKSNLLKTAATLFLSDILKLTVIEDFFISLCRLIKWFTADNNSNETAEPINHKREIALLFAGFLVMGNVTFFAITTFKGSLHDCIEHGWNKTNAKVVATLALFGAIIGGLGFSEKKVKSVVPHLKEMITGRWTDKKGRTFYTEKGKWKKIFAGSLFFIVFATTGANYMLARKTMTGFLPILSLALLTIISYMVCLSTLYRGEIALAEGNLEKIKKTAVKKGVDGKENSSENQYSTWGKILVLGACLLFSLANLLISGISGGFGWEKFAYTTLGVKSLIGLGFILGVAALATIFQRFYFSNFWDRTKEISNEVYSVKNIFQQPSSSTEGNATDDMIDQENISTLQSPPSAQTKAG